MGPKALLAVPTLVGLAFSFLAAALAFFHTLAFSDRRPPSATPLGDLKVPNPKHSDLALQLVVLGIPIQTNWTETHGNCLCHFLLASG